MSLAKYGFQKLVLLNSAGYSRAELPLDNSVSIVAPNNTGKTSLINALQFLLILDQRNMDFGAHSLEVSRRFYFPDNCSYILLEVLLPSGSAVIACVGKGLSHDYEYFAYSGSLDVDDYRLEDGSLVSQPKLISHLMGRNKQAKIYQQTDLRALLYGNRLKQQSGTLDLTIFPLEYTSQAPIYQRILTRTLRLDRLDTREVKNYLLEIFKNDLLDDKALNKAKDLLIKEGEARGSIRVEHLFRLVFKIAKEDQKPAEFENIDSAASNGTVLMAKLITGLAMLNQMQNPKKAIKTLCYLDEAASLDQNNQRNLIKTAAEFGFTLIFASPEPLITARYCVPIGTKNGVNYINRFNWQILEPIDEQ